MKDEIKKAIELLHNNGYAVKKITKSMIEDSDRCEKYDDLECFECSCSICIMQ